MTQTKIGIIGAMEVELALLKKQLKPILGQNTVKETLIGSRTFIEGNLNGTNVVLVQCGVGKVNAALCAERLIIQFGVTHIINTGIAGAMANGLRVLDFVVSTDAVYHDFNVGYFGYKLTAIPGMGDSTFVSDSKLVQIAKKAFSSLSESENHQLVEGRIASGDQFIASSEQKAHIRQICNPACVEMEGAAIAHTCYLEKIPFVIIRCMSDMADNEGGKTYDFNEETAANLSAHFVSEILSQLNQNNF